jgi:adenosylcobinamide-phosphate synthase
MVGYKSERYRYFGHAGARLDDIVNFIPARLSVVFLTMGAFLCRMNLSECLSVTFRDRLKHASPNAGHPESCVAGALDIRLGGPVTYAYGVVQKPWMGNGTSSAGTKHIRKALSLVNCSFFICSIVVVMILMFL